MKNWVGEVQKFRLNETWDISYSRWTEMNIEEVSTKEKTADIVTYEGDILIDVPLDTFKVV
jgi:hypothetical protein